MGGQIIFVKIALVKDALTKKDSYSLKKLIKSVVIATVHKKVEAVLLPKAEYMDSVFIPGIKACVYTAERYWRFRVMEIKEIIVINQVTNENQKAGILLNHIIMFFLIFNNHFEK